MAKRVKEKNNEKTVEKITVGQAIKDLELDSNEIIIVHKYRTNMSEDVICTVKELTDKQLKSQVDMINKGCGGMKYNYKAWFFIIK